mmetsp:Transcript_42322/g.70591  ORF Transcript_42322/g.70591 Transcript_42322/m.70591 type:complete len:336 (+) Transcript_42322:295-1302(+)
MPFNVWCEACHTMIAKGVRFNAKKNHVGNYFSTKIWEFEMPCHQCFNIICVKTDPKNAEYLVTKGAKKKVEDYDAKKAGTVELLSLEEREARRADAMASLEVTETDKKQAKEQRGRMELLRDLSDRMKDDYAVSSLLRKRFRKRKKELKEEDLEAMRPGIAIRIKKATLEDRQEAALVRFDHLKRCENDRAAKRFRIKSGIFSSTHSSSSSSSKKLDSSKRRRRRRQIKSNRFASQELAIERALRSGLDPVKLKLLTPTVKKEGNITIRSVRSSASIAGNIPVQSAKPGTTTTSRRKERRKKKKAKQSVATSREKVASACSADGLNLIAAGYDSD